MARLYDRIMAGEKVAHGPVELPAVLRQVQVVVIDNVAEYFFHAKGTVPDHRDSWRWADFPNAAPPFDKAWFEFRWSLPGFGRLQIGVLVFATQETMLRLPYDDVVYEVEAPEDGWIVEARAVVREPGRRGAYTPGAWLYAVQPSGAICTAMVGVDGGTSPVAVAVQSPEWTDRVGDHLVQTGTSEDKREAAVKFIFKNLCRQTLFPCLLAISFMHCKNVERREVTQPPALNKKWEKKHGRPLVRYHVLDIDPMKKVLRDEGRSAETGLKKALHICRGHFATYTEDAPLFGRITGTFWKPQHVRGSAAEGVVVKDYNVKAPKGVTHA